MQNAARRWSFRTAIIFALLLLVTLLTAAVAMAQSGQPSGITEEAESLHRLYLIVLAMALVVFVAVEGALVFIIFRYRRRNDELPAQTHGNNILEVVWTTIPIIIVLVLFVFSYIALVDVEGKADEEDLTVHVTGFQFSWIFEYELSDLGTVSDANADGRVRVTGNAAEVPQLWVPVGEPVEFVLNSPDVIHSFYQADLLYKLDIIPGRQNQFKVTFTDTGVYHGQCAELCGLNHALMRFELHVVERPEFDAYIASLPVEPGATGDTEEEAAAARPR